MKQDEVCGRAPRSLRGGTEKRQNRGLMARGAQVNLGSLYAQGKGVRQNFEESARWFLKAAEQGNAEAQYRMARIIAKEPECG